MPRSYNGSSDVSKSSTSAISALPLTIAGWVYSTTTATTQYAFGLQASASNGGWRVGFATTSVVFQAVGGTTQTATATSAASANTWMHLAGVTSAANSRTLYKNGTSVATSTTSTTVGAVAQVRIGAGSTSGGAASNFWTGAIGNVGIWNVALTASEIGALANGAPPISIRPANLVGWYPLGAPYSNSVADMIGGRSLDTTPAEYGSNPSTFYWPGSDGITTKAPTLNNYTLTCSQGSFTLTGQDAIVTAQRTMAAAQGSYTLSGQAANLNVGYLLTATQGSYALTGQDAALTAQRTMTAAQGSFTVTGQDAALTTQRTLVASQGTYSVTGQDVALTAQRTLTAAQGSYALTGQDAVLSRGISVALDSGTFTLVGQDATLKADRTLAAGQGSFSVAGQDVTLSHGYTMSLDQGAFSLAGQDATLSVGRLLECVVGVFTLTGYDANLSAQVVEHDYRISYKTRWNATERSAIARAKVRRAIAASVERTSIERARNRTTIATAIERGDA